MMIGTISTFRAFTFATMLGSTLLAAGCGSSPDPVTRTTTIEQTRTVQPPPATTTTTTTTQQVQQAH